MMCFENINMPGNLSRAIFSLLLFGTILQGLEGKVFCNETVEAAVGQNISLPCFFNSSTVDLKIVMIEWRRNESAKLVVYNEDNEPYYFSREVYFKPEMDDHNKLMGSYLHLYHAQINNSGTYVCELATYPLGSFRKVIRLKVKATTESTSQNTDHSSTGVNIPTTVSVEANFTAETGQNLTSSVPTPAITMASIGMASTEIHLSNHSKQVTTANPYATESHDDSFSVWPTAGSSTTTLGLETHHGSTKKTGNVTEEHVPSESTTLGGVTTTSGNLSSSHLTTGDKTVVTVETAGWGIGFVFLGMAILLTLAMCVLLGVLYRRRTIRRRMDLPPPFKPPPPSKKYASVKPHPISNSCSC